MAETAAEMIRRIWNEQRETALKRVEVIASFASQRENSSDVRKSAIGEAHKLAGALGSFGLNEGSDIAKKIQLALETQRQDDAFWSELVSQATQLRDKILDFQA